MSEPVQGHMKWFLSRRRPRPLFPDIDYPKLEAPLMQMEASMTSPQYRKLDAQEHEYVRYGDYRGEPGRRPYTDHRDHEQYDGEVWYRAVRPTPIPGWRWADKNETAWNEITATGRLKPQGSRVVRRDQPEAGPNAWGWGWIMSWDEDPRLDATPEARLAWLQHDFELWQARDSRTRGIWTLENRGEVKVARLEIGRASFDIVGYSSEKWPSILERLIDAVAYSDVKFALPEHEPAPPEDCHWPVTGPGINDKNTSAKHEARLAWLRRDFELWLAKDPRAHATWKLEDRNPEESEFGYGVARLRLRGVDTQFFMLRTKGTSWKDVVAWLIQVAATTHDEFEMPAHAPDPEPIGGADIQHEDYV